MLSCINVSDWLAIASPNPLTIGVLAVYGRQTRLCGSHRKRQIIYFELATLGCRT